LLSDANAPSQQLLIEKKEHFLIFIKVFSLNITQHDKILLFSDMVVIWFYCAFIWYLKLLPQNGYKIPHYCSISNFRDAPAKNGIVNRAIRANCIALLTISIKENNNYLTINNMLT